MITIERRLAGVMPYTAMFFPTAASVHEAAERLDSTRIAKLFWTAMDLEGGPCLLRHYVSATVCQSLEDAPEGVLRVASKTCRYEIRQAEKLGARIRIRRNEPEASLDFMALYADFARSKREVFAISDRAFGRYREYADTFVLYFDEKPMCGHLILRDPGSGRVRLLYSASRRLDDKETARLCASLNRFLHFYEMRLYGEENFEAYDFGGIRKDGLDGIAKFKLSFGGQIINEHTYLCASIPWLGRIVVGLFENLSARGRRWRPLIAKDVATGGGGMVHRS